jgi:predicted transcriptional regulator
LVKKREGDKSHSTPDILFSILYYLYNKPDGRSPTDIQLFCSDTTQAYGNIKNHLEHLIKQGAIVKVKISTSRSIYKLTAKGKEIVNVSKGLLKGVYFLSVDIESERYLK